MTEFRQQFDTPSGVSVPSEMSISRSLRERAAARPGDVALERASSLGTSWVPMTLATFHGEVVDIARGLIASGLAPGDRFAIFAATSYEWTLLDYAGWAAGLVPVPIFESSSAEQVGHILRDAGITVAVGGTAAQRQMCEDLVDTPLREALSLDEDAIEVLRSRCHAVDAGEVAARTEALTKDSLATIIYTSGTTGLPKGVMLSHENFVYLARNAMTDDGLREQILARPGARTLLFLPLAHVFARFVQVLCLENGVVLGHSPGAANLVADLQTFRPTFLLAVPRVFEKIYNAADAKAGAGPKQRIFRWAAKTAIETSRARDTPEGPSRALRAQHRLADRLVFRTLRDLLTPDLTDVISGGAPLGERLGHFYRCIGLRIYEGYGLTETAAPTTINTPARNRIGTVGPPFPGTSIAIAEDGEVLVRGPHVMGGYWGNDAASAEALTEDGWLHTGDLGDFDEDGFLRITGRRKDIIVTAGGKNVAPAILEDRLRGHPLVSQVVVVGNDRPFIGALVTLDADMLPGWLANKGIEPMSVEEAAHDERVLAALDRAVERANRAVSRAESIRKIEVLDSDFTEKNGYLTPSLKVKRAQVAEDFAEVIDRLYGTR